jgi:hypothetical protein
MTKDPTVTMPVVQSYSTQSNIQDQTFSLHNPHQRYLATRDRDRRLARWDFPHDHFETFISNFIKSQPEEVPKVKYPQSYQAMFGGTPGTVHMIKEGVKFAYLNHGNKAFERVEINLAHAHMVIPMGKKLMSTSETSSASNFGDAYTNYFTPTVMCNLSIRW